MREIIELLNTEPFNVAKDGGSVRFHNIEHDFEIREDGNSYSITFEGEKEIGGLGGIELAALLERRLGARGLTDDYRLMIARG